MRIYPKLQEIHETSAEQIPVDVNKDFEYYMMLNDELHDYIRLEFQFRRQTLRYFFHNAKSVTVADVMQEQFQVERIVNVNIKMLKKWKIKMYIFLCFIPQLVFPRRTAFL